MRYLRLLQDCDVKIYVGQLIVSHTTHYGESAATKPKQRSVHDYVPRQEIQCGGKCLYLKKKLEYFTMMYTINSWETFKYFYELSNIMPVRFFL